MTILIANCVTLISVSVIVISVAHTHHEEKLDRICAQLEQQQWGYLAPPMERNDVWMAREKAKREMCSARIEVRRPD